MGSSERQVRNHGELKNEWEFRQYMKFNSASDYASALKNAPLGETKKIQILANLYNDMEKYHYDDQRKKGSNTNIMGDNSLLGADAQWGALLKAKRCGVCRDHAYLVYSIAKQMGYEATMVSFSRSPDAHMIPVVKGTDGSVYLIDDGYLKIGKNEDMLEEVSKMGRMPNFFEYDNGRMVETKSLRWLNESSGTNFGIGASYYRNLLLEGDRKKGFSVDYHGGESIVAQLRSASNSLALFQLDGSTDSSVAIKTATGAACQLYGKYSLNDKTSVIFDGQLGIIAARTKAPALQASWHSKGDSNASSTVALAQFGAYLERGLGRTQAWKVISGINGSSQIPLNTKAMKGTPSIPLLGIYEAKSDDGMRQYEMFGGAMAYLGNVASSYEGGGHGQIGRGKALAGARADIEGRLGKIRLGLLIEKEADAPNSRASGSISLSEQVRTMGRPIKVEVGGEYTRDINSMQQTDGATSYAHATVKEGKKWNWWIGVENKNAGGTSDTRLVGGVRILSF
jgi:hypothetical protein